MKPMCRLSLSLFVLGVLVLAGGCASTDVNPAGPRTGRGYVDLYTVPQADVEVEVLEGKITPVRVAISSGGGTFVRVVEDRFSVSKRNEVTDQAQSQWQLSAAAEPSVAYVPKAQVHYRQ